jgi:hypothetical protein
VKLKAKKRKMAELSRTRDHRPYAEASELMGASRVLPDDPRARPLAGSSVLAVSVSSSFPQPMAPVPEDVQQRAGEQQKERPVAG